MKRIKSFLIVITLLTLLLFAAGCGINQNLGASMYDPNETEEPVVEAEVQEDYDDQEEKQEEQLNQTEEDQITDDRVVTVLLNTNKDRKRIHIDGESCTKHIKPENRQEWTGTADELIEYAKEHGYVACGSCHPEIELGIDLPINNKEE